MNSERRSRSRSRSPIQSGNKVTSTSIEAVCVFVKNIPIECDAKDLEDFFNEKVGDVSSVELFYENGKFKGHGIVEFKDPDLAQKAVDIMFKHKLKGRRLIVKFECDDIDKNTSERLNDTKIKNEPVFDTYGIDPDLLKSLGISGPLSKKVLIFNIDRQVNEKKLDEIFQMAGKISKLDIHTSDGNSKAAVQYQHPLEAVQAISMLNGQKLYSQVINVVMDSSPSENSLTLPAGLQGIGKGLGPNGQPMQFTKTTSDSPIDKNNDKDSSASCDVFSANKGKDSNATDNTTETHKTSASGKGDNLNNGTAKESPFAFYKSKGAQADGRCTLTCTVCLQNCVQPVLLPCYHIFCFLCVKGCASSSPLCPLCRQEIPSNYLNNPQLVASQQSNVAFDGSYQWFYEGRHGWWQYDDRTSSEIEAAYQRREDRCEVLIAGKLYTIDFRQNIQTQKFDQSRRRQIKRDLITIPKKGVAGIRVNPEIEVITPVPSEPRPEPDLVDLSSSNSSDYDSSSRD